MSLQRIFVLSVLTVSAAGAFGSAAMADSVDFNLRDRSAQLQYSASMGTSTLGKSQLHAGVLYVDKDHMFADFGLLVKDEVGSSAPGLSVGVGIKGFGAKLNTNNTLGLALGAEVRYSPPTIAKLGVVGQLYVSPNIVTFGDADRYIETGARVEYEVIPQAAAYLGYRKIKFGLEVGPDVILDEGLYVGVRMSF